MMVMSDVKRRVRFGGGREVCCLGMGTWNMGVDAAKRWEEIDAIRAAVECGMDVVDTAEMYGNEEMVGVALEGLRGRVFLVGKVLPENASFKGTIAACRRSLRKLRTDHFDMYLLHWSGPYDIRETVDAMEWLVEVGMIGCWGVSNMDVERMERFMGVNGGCHCATDQVLYNLAHRGVEYDLMPWCRDHGMTMMAYSPILQGELLRSDVVRDFAAMKGCTPSQVALAWTLRNPCVMAIAKTGSARHVEENMRALEVVLGEDELEYLDGCFPAPRCKVPLDTI